MVTYIILHWRKIVNGFEKISQYEQKEAGGIVKVDPKVDIFIFGFSGEIQDTRYKDTRYEKPL